MKGKIMVTLDEEEIEELYRQEPLAQISEGPEPSELLPEDWPVRCDDPIVD